MLKKNAWIAALVVALSMVFINCPVDGGFIPDDRGQGGAKEWTTVFQFSLDAGIQALPVGSLTFGAGDAGNPIKPLVRAAEDVHASYEIIKVDGKNALKYVTHATWGPGFDLPNKVFGFAEGDKITVKGKAEGAPIDLAFNKNQGAAQQIVGNHITAEGDFTVEVELTAGDVTAIQNNEQAVLRFEDRAGETTVTITEIIIEGYRVSSIQPLPAPVLTLTGDTLSWPAVEGAGGYELYTGGEKPVRTITAATTSVKLNVALNGEAEGAKTVTLVAVGIPGSSGNSAASNSVSYTYAAISIPVTISVDGSDKAAAVKLFGGTAEFAALTDTANVGYKVTGGHDYSNSFPYIEVDLGTTKLSGIATVAFKATQVSGDITYKRFQVSVAEAAASPSFKVLTRKSSNRWEGATSNTTIPLSVSLNAYATLIIDSGLKDVSKLAFSLNPGVAASAAYEITDIEITTGTPAADELISGTNLDITLAAPVTGVAPVATVSKSDGGENPVYTGTVKWTPNDSKFDVYTAYVATITLTAGKTYKLSDSDTTAWTVNSSAADVTVIANAMGVGVIKVFDATVALGPLGVRYNLADDATLTTATLAAGTSWLYLDNVGGATVAVDPTTKAISVTARNDGNDCVVIKLFEQGADLSLYRKHEFKITGKVTKATGTAATQFALGKIASPYGSYGTVNLGDDGSFTLTYTFSWADLSEATGTGRIGARLSPAHNSGWNNDGDAYEITGITITAVE